MNCLKLILAALFAPVAGVRRQGFRTANAETAAGTHEVLTRRADGAHATRYLLVKSGSDALHAAVAGAADYPIGTTSDTPGAAEDIINVLPLNSTKHTRLLRVATAVPAGVDLYTGADGFAQALPAVAGTYYRVGRSVAAAAQEGAGLYAVEAATHAPVKTIVIAAATGTAGTDIAAVFTALASGPAELKALS